MGRIKNYVVLSLLMVASFSCEKETIDLHVEDAKTSEDLTFLEFLNSGIDVNEYLLKVRANEVKIQSINKSHSWASYEEAVFTEFCSDLPVETFETGEMDPGLGGIFRGPLNEYTCCHKFDTGDILPGISISADEVVLALFGHDFWDNASKVIYADDPNADLYIDFTSDVNSVSLDILSFPHPESNASQQVTIDVYDSEGNLLHTEEITASVEGSFWSFAADEIISRIVLSSTNEDAWIGVDNIAFGECDIPDADNDGCTDNDDTNDFSNLESTIKIGDCESEVENRMTSSCGITMADIIDELEVRTYKNKGEFVKTVAHLVNVWFDADLVSSAEKDALISCAANANL